MQSEFSALSTFHDYHATLDMLLWTLDWNKSYTFI